MIFRVRYLLPVIFAVLGQLFAQHPGLSPETLYTISLAHGGEHQLEVTMEFQEPGNEHALLLPVWNARYQVRDFAEFVSAVRAFDASGAQLPVVKKEKSKWLVNGSGRIRVSYMVYAAEAGPCEAEATKRHAFFNLAEVLMFTEPTRNYPLTLKFADVPAHWKLGIALPSKDTGNDSKAQHGYFVYAKSYDELVDSPVDLGNFSEDQFTGSAGEIYRVIIDSDKAFDHKKVLDHLQRITAAETEWMQDVPFKEYVFLFHFRRSGYCLGMEHSYSTAIDVAVPDSATSFKEFDAVSAHEFFHLWNVKRIHSSGLDHIDYMKENYTDALWFSEGVTEMRAQRALLSAGLITPAEYIDRLTLQISMLQARPAHTVQPVEESSIDTWFDLDHYYQSPGRSVNYYNKGNILGVLLDLAMREATHGTKSLRDLFLYMNTQYGKTGKPFHDSAAIQEAVGAVTGASFKEFFQRYIAGTEELPYEALFQTVGYRFESPRIGHDLGFDWELSGPQQVIKGSISSRAASAGVKQGEVLLAIDHQPPPADRATVLAHLHEGQAVTITVLQEGKERDIKVPIGTFEISGYRLVESREASAEQLQRRKEWIGK